MANLLPQKQLKAMRREKALRMASVALALALVVLISGCVFLLPSLILSKSKASGAKEQMEAIVGVTGDDDSNSIVAEVLKTEKFLDEATLIFNDVSSQEIISGVVEKTGTDIEISSLRIERDDGGDQSLRVFVGGTGRNREALIAFSERLESDARFDSVNLPVSNLAESQNVKFTIDLDVLRGI